MSINRSQQRGGRSAPLVRLALALAAIYALWLAQAWHPARADSLWLVGSGASYHFDRSKDYNERNWGVGFEWGLVRDTRAILGTYLNSHGQQSTYGGVAWTPLALGPARAGAILGAVDGYENVRNGHVFPMGSLLATLERGRFGVNLLAAPRWKDSPGVLGLQLKFRID